MTSPVHIAQLIATLDPGGAEIQLVQLARGLLERGYRVSVVALTRGGALADELRKAGAGVSIVGKHRKLDPGALRRLARVLKTLQPDILHTHMFTSNTYGRLASRMSPVRATVATEHSLGLEKTALHRRIDRWLARTTRAITCPTRAIRTQLVSRGIPAERVHVIANAVPIASLRRRASLARRPSDPASPSDRATRLIAVARLDPIKALPVLVEATARLRAAGRRVRLLLVGEGPDRARIERAAAHAGLLHTGAVELAGHLSDPAPLLAASDIFCLPSRSEGLPTAVLEAMALGLPVVASRLPGMEEVVSNEETGLLIEPGDPAALAHAIDRLLEDPTRARAFGAAGHQRAKRLFDAPIAVEAYDRLYQSIL